MCIYVLIILKTLKNHIHKLYKIELDILGTFINLFLSNNKHIMYISIQEVYTYNVCECVHIYIYIYNV